MEEHSVVRGSHAAATSGQKRSAFRHSVTMPLPEDLASLVSLDPQKILQRSISGSRSARPVNPTEPSLTSLSSHPSSKDIKEEISNLHLETISDRMSDVEHEFDENEIGPVLPDAGTNPLPQQDSQQGLPKRASAQSGMDADLTKRKLETDPENFAGMKKIAKEETDGTNLQAIAPNVPANHWFQDSRFLQAALVVLLLDAWYVHLFKAYGPFMLAVLGLLMFAKNTLYAWYVKDREADKKDILHLAADEVDWSQRLRIVIGESGFQIAGGRGQREDQQENLPKLVTQDFREKLLNYANKVWKQLPQAPSSVMALEVVDRGQRETQDADGKVNVQLLKESLFVPMAETIQVPREIGNETLSFHEQVWFWERLFGQEKKDEDNLPHILYAPLTPSGDIQLGFKRQAAKLKTKKEKATKHKRKTASKIRQDWKGEQREDDDADSTTAEVDEEEFHQELGGAECFLEVYGQDSFAKVQQLIQTILEPGLNMIKPKAKEELNHKTLYWYEFARWGKSQHDGSIVPKFKMKPMPGDRTFQEHYHYAFFHPQKDRLLGNSFSLLDQFRDRTGNFSVPGSPQKLNFLLYGPPGTGKSMFIRTMAMYLQRHVVSFNLSDMHTNEQFLTLLDDLQRIPKPPRPAPTGTPTKEEMMAEMMMAELSMMGQKRAEGEFKYEDLLFVIEEIDTDKRRICNPRSAEEEATVQEEPTPPATAPSPNGQGGKGAKERQGIIPEDEQDDMDGFDVEEIKAMPPRTQRAMMQQMQMDQMMKQQRAPPPPQTTTNLDLGMILKTLDGGSETPGRIIAMTSNRIDQLDEAFKRPGRMKKIYMSNLQFEEFRKIIFHYRRNELGVPTNQIWTVEVSTMAQLIFEDFQALQKMRTGDLDTRGLGISPALLVELCMDSHSIHELFHLLIDELEKQGKKAVLEEEPKSKFYVEKFDWRMNTIRQTVVFHVGRRAPDRDETTATKHFLKLEEEWPETPLPEPQMDGEAAPTMKNYASNKTIQLVTGMLEDERTLNAAFEQCPQDHALKDGDDFKYRLQIELALGRPAHETRKGYTLSYALGVLRAELKHRWAKAWALRDMELQKLLKSEFPPSLKQRIPDQTA